MARVLALEREIALTWGPDIVGPDISEQVRGGTRQLLAVPDGRKLLASRDVTAVGFFGRLRKGVDHAVLFEHERAIAQTFPAFAPLGFLSYFDFGPEHGRYGNLILFWTPDVPDAWHKGEIAPGGGRRRRGALRAHPPAPWEDPGPVHGRRAGRGDTDAVPRLHRAATLAGSAGLHLTVTPAGGPGRPDGLLPLSWEADDLRRLPAPRPPGPRGSSAPPHSIERGDCASHIHHAEASSGRRSSARRWLSS